MKFLTYQIDTNGESKVGVLVNQTQVLDLSSDFVDMLALIDGGEEALELVQGRVAAGGPKHDIDDLKVNAPLRPRQLRDFIAFELHLKQAMFQTLVRKMGKGAAYLMTKTGMARIPKVWYEQPMYYKGNRFAISGPDDEIQWPAYSQVMDYELELACVIGKGGKDIPKERAAEFIFGYTIFNDLSARDAQAKEMGIGFHLGPAKGKDFDGANVLGPWLVTADEIPDPYSLQMSATVNGELWSAGSSASMHWRFEDMIAWVSQSETLYPGEVLGSGTVGNGCGLEQGRFLADGDVVELAIEGLGVLRNRIRR